MTIRLILDMAAQAGAGRTALLPGAGDPVTFGRLAEVADAGSALLGRLGGRTLAFIGVNSPAVPALLFAAAGAGVPFAPLNYRLAEPALRELIARLDAPVLVTDPSHRLDPPGNAVASITTGEWFDLLASPGAEDAPGAASAAASEESPAVLLFTSGTTSAPKCAVLRHANLLAYVLGTVEFDAAAADDCALLSVPPYHIAGIGAVLTNAYSGRKAAYLTDFTPEGWLDVVRTRRVSHAMVVPTMLARIVEHLGDRPADCPSLTSLAYGGARMPLPVLTRALEAFPSTGFVNAYGLTETSSTIAVLGPADHRAAVAAGEAYRLASVGRVVPGVEAEIRGEDGRAVPAGATGELWVRGPQVSGEYTGLGSVLDAAGWFPTRDLARLDEQGYLYVEGRADDTIIRGGENIAPAEIEDVLLLHGAVREAAVVGTADPHWGERLVAVVVPAGPAGTAGPAAAAGADLAAELRAFVRARLRGSRTPDEVVFRSELPYTPTGKLLRREIVAGLAAGSTALA
ncbi:long-chain fatty acid--CoA ligase [Actinomadura sp. NAK00032]|uniref:class I adenylate-forming enzyme family protein n=1 Tax=Actinomadura sp. NAK00032 TaxID=2742128 RepID=UPI001590C75E|nr:fatty acid--CoA ligase family protein [Actinomadura sp. NAK00032]QKW35558.1 long-chain fatty acid--CoA ligase [Actinomadura sp. NAK00032]